MGDDQSNFESQDESLHRFKVGKVRGLEELLEALNLSVRGGCFEQLQTR